MVFSVMLWMPSWGGMINGLMTLSGAWDKLRTDPILRMMVIAVAFYGMSTFEGPVMSIRDGQLAVALHRLDHRPRAFRRARLGRHDLLRRDLLPDAEAVEPRAALFSLRLVNWHFWLATIGIVLYASAMWVSGIMQGLMWREYDEQGFLVYSFVETVAAMHPYYLIRALGGLLYLTGALIMAFNVWNDDPRRPAPGASHARLRPAIQPAE